MDLESKTRNTFPLRLPRPILQRAKDLAQAEGISVNRFIGLAIEEKLSRIERQIAQLHQVTGSSK